MRADILGNSGSGKSTLARWLEEKTGCYADLVEHSLKTRGSRRAS